MEYIVKRWRPTELEYSVIIPGKLCVGSAPPTGAMLFHAAFDVVLLCAEEYQPKHFPGVEVEHYPLPDFELNEAIIRRSVIAAKSALFHIQRGKRVLITCLAGHDRSASVAALVLHLLKGWSGKKCIKHIQAKRPKTLEGVQALWLARI